MSEEQKAEYVAHCAGCGGPLQRTAAMGPWGCSTKRCAGNLGPPARPEFEAFKARVLENPEARAAYEKAQRRRDPEVYIDTNDWWIGYYRGDSHHYVCPLPTVVIRWRRRTPIRPDMPPPAQPSSATAATPHHETGTG